MRDALFYLGFLCSPPLLADAADKRLVPLGPQSLFETLGGLLLVLALILGAAWLFKRYARLPTAGKGLVSIVGGVSVGPRERVIVLQIENTRLVVGVAPGQVNKLHILSGEQPKSASPRNQDRINQERVAIGNEGAK